MIESRAREEVPAAATASVAAVARPAHAVSGQESFGKALKAAREARGWAESDVCAQLRLQLRQVRAIEAEDLASLPEGPFVRGFVRNYARLLGLPAEPLLAQLTARMTPAEPLRMDDGGTAATGLVQMAARERLSRVAVVGGAVAALLLFAALGWWSMRSDRRDVGGDVPPAAPVTQQPASPASPPASAPGSPSQPAPAAEPPSADAREGGAAAAAATARAGSAPLTELRFSFRDRSWVEVRQEDGGVLISRTFEPGEIHALNGQPPYRLTIGNASKVDLEYRGKPVDLASSIVKDDVARLRLD
jgi:cytoskeleton protein RodZ